MDTFELRVWLAAIWIAVIVTGCCVIRDIDDRTLRIATTIYEQCGEER